MKRIFTAILLVTAMVFADARLGAPSLSERPLFVQGKIKIQLTEAAQYSGMLNIDNSTKSYSMTGIESLDDLNIKNSATGMKNAHMGAKNTVMEKELGLDRWYLLEIPKEKDVLAVIEDYKKDPNIEFANPEYLMYTQAIPNDTYHVSHHWGHNNTAQMLAWTTGDTYNHTGSPVGTVGFDTNAHAGWDGSQGYGSTTVVIGIIDSGVDTAHEDITDVAGYDFGDGDTNPFDNSAEPGHGTCCAGVAAGIANNGKGVAGTAGACKIMPLKVADSAGSMAFTSIESALIWGADNGADVLSMSLGAAISPGYSPATDAAILYAYNAGSVVLAATGNENATSISYPANHANCLAVGAASPEGLRKDKTTDDGEYWWGSNYGTTTADGAAAVDFIAPTILPATDISGTAGYQTGNYYLYFNGTSCATPYAAGFAALIKSKYPTYTPAQVASLMKSTAIDVEAAGWDKEAGYGMINLQGALNPGGTPPGVPTLVSPTNGSTVADLTPTFDWNDVTDATSYTIQVDNNNTFASPEATSSPTVSTFTPASNLAAGTYYWRVLATNVAGSSAYCAYWSVTLTAPLPIPDVPVLISPTNGGTVQDLTPTFDWNDAANATSYHIQVSTKSNMSGLVIDTDVTGSTYTPAANMAANLYYWRVLSINATGSSTYTSTWSVTVTTPPPLPGTPTLIAPANGSGTADTTPDFDWSDASDATGYEILVDNNSTFLSPEINTTSVTSAYTAASALTLGTYYWKVRGTNATGAGAYTAAWSFTIGTAPAVPVLALPTNGSFTSDLTPTFDWNDVSGATSYTILVDNTSDFSSPEVTNSPTVSTYTPAANLAVGTYYWKVLATNIYGSSAYCTAWTVNLGNPPAVPVLALPADGSSTTDATPTFDWNDVSGATSYTILVDNDIAFGSPEITNSPTVSTYTPAANLANGTQYWKVLATNAYGSSAYCAVWSFSIGSVPGVPTLVAPANTSLTTDLTPTFDWSDVVSATSYTILVDNDIAFGSPEINQSPTVSTYTPAANLAVGTHYWKVLATNSYGSSVYSGSWSVSLGNPPAVPTLATPTNGSATSDQTPAFDWNDVSGATSYTILVDNDVAFGSPEITNSPTVSTFTPSANLAYGTYYWKVLATNAYGSSAYSGSWSVIIQAPLPGDPTLISPADGSGSTNTTPAFDWSDDAYATGYEIMADNNSNFSSPEISTSTVSSDYTAVSALAVGTYYWKVRSTNATGSSAYTTAWTFTVQAPANISLSVASISTTAAPEGTDTDLFNILNSGDVNLDYTITKEYVAKKADITVESNDFAAGLGTYTNTGTLTWTAAGGQALLNATAANASGILNTDTFDGTVCTSLTLTFDQVFTTTGLSTAVVEYFNGTAWTQIYSATASTSISQTISLPVLASNMQIRFTGTMRKNTGDSWSVDNVVVSGPAAGPAYTWLNINSALTGSVTPAGSNAINITCDAAGLAVGIYNANITVASNDPDEPNKVLPVQFTVEITTVVPGVPSNVRTSVVGTDIVVDWDIATDATSYDVYSSTDPYGTFTFVTNVTANQYVTPYTEVKKFWYIVAKNATK